MRAVAPLKEFWKLLLRLNRVSLEWKEPSFVTFEMNKLRIHVVFLDPCCDACVHNVIFASNKVMPQGIFSERVFVRRETAEPFFKDTFDEDTTKDTFDDTKFACRDVRHFCVKKKTHGVATLMGTAILAFQARGSILDARRSL